MSASPVPPGAPLDLDAIEARANAASAGPWMCWNSWGPVKGTDLVAMAHLGPEGISGGVLGALVGRSSDVYATRADAEFVAHARADIPALCAEVRRLQARLALVPPKLCGRCEATLHPERRERTLCRRCQTDAIREGVSRAWRNRRRAALAPTGEPGNG